MILLEGDKIVLKGKSIVLDGKKVALKGKDVIIKGGMNTKIGGTKILIKAGATCTIKGGAKVVVRVLLPV